MGYLLLAGCIAAYAIGIVAQAVAARRDAGPAGVGLLARLARDRVYVLGFVAQVLGFGLAFFSRASLPLYLVQAGASSAVGISTVLGAVFLGWRVRAVEVAVVVATAGGIALLVGAAQPGVAAAMPPSTDVVLAAVLVVVAVAGAIATRGRMQVGSVTLGALAGAAFAVLAVAGRPVAALPLLQMPTQALAWLAVAAAAVGQVLQAAALQQGSSTAAMAPAYAVNVTLASAVGLLALGDRVVPGREAWLATGLALVVGGVVAMAVVRPGAGHERDEARKERSAA